MSFLGRYNPNSFSLPVLNSNKREPIEVKLVMIGESSVGKSSIVTRLVYNNFKFDTNTTIGGSFCGMVKKHNNREYKFQIWDTAGQERFRSLVPMYVKNSQIILLVFDITSRDSYEKIQNHWYDYVNKISEDSIKILIGSKSDLEKERCVNKSGAKRYANELDMEYVECSAKDTTNISDLLNLLLKTSEQLKTHEEPYYVDDTRSNRMITLDNGWEEEKYGCFDMRCNP